MLNRSPLKYLAFHPMGCCFSSSSGGHRKRPVTSTSQLPQSRAESSQTTGYSTSVASRRGDGGGPPNSTAISVGAPAVTSSAVARSKKEGESNEIAAARHAQNVAEDRLREVMLSMEGVTRERDAAVAREVAAKDALARVTSASPMSSTSTRTGAETASRLLGLLRTHLGGEE